MLFGLIGNHRAFSAAWAYCEPIFASLHGADGRRVPAAVFEDAYVLGFLQPIVIEAVNGDAGKAAETEVWLQAMQRVVNRLAPKAGRRLLAAMEVLSDPTHPENANYRAGLKDGSSYALALHAGNGHEAKAVMIKFQQHLRADATKA